MRDHGSCRFGDNCRFSHEQEEVKKARAALAPVDSGKGKDPKGKGKGGKKGKHAKGKGKEQKDQPVTRVKYPDKLCRDIAAGKPCSRGADCAFSHDRNHFDDEGKPKAKKTHATRQPQQQQQQQSGQQADGSQQLWPGPPSWGNSPAPAGTCGWNNSPFDFSVIWAGNMAVAKGGSKSRGK